MVFLTINENKLVHIQPDTRVLLYHSHSVLIQSQQTSSQRLTMQQRAASVDSLTFRCTTCMSLLFVLGAV